MIYEKKDILRLARRLHNTKREYLLVNPLQGKHIPVRPSVSLDMMECLGEKLRQRFPGAKLVIGFAETATAVGAAAANCLGGDCVYIHTTREHVSQAEKWIFFQEEHSHAVDQKLCIDHLREWIAASPQVILIDDEISTGKTILNMTAQMRRIFPELQKKTVIAASIINRLSGENEARLSAAGIVCEALLHIPEEDYTAVVRRFQTESPADHRKIIPTVQTEICKVDFGDADLRTGVVIGQYRKACGEVTARIMPCIQKHLGPDKRVLVLGTEEFMYLPLLLAEEIAALSKSVCFHATTRSPIQVSQVPDYPIFNGCQLTSFYEADRKTYIYDLAEYDTAIVLSDSKERAPEAINSLASALHENGCHDILFLCGGEHV